MKIAKGYGLSVEEYKSQQGILEQANRVKNMEQRKRIDLAFEDEEPTCTYSNLPGIVQTPTYFPSPSERSPLSLPTSSSGSPTQDPPGRAERCPSPTERLPILSFPSQPTYCSGPPIQDPSQFAIGSMVYIPTQRGDPLRGVVMWLGTMPEFPGVIAGVELVSHISLIH